MNHVLVVGAPHTGKIRVASLFDVDLSDVDTTAPHTGLILPSTIVTKYFTVDFKLFIDEYGSRSSTPEIPLKSPEKSLETLENAQTWKQEFLSSLMLDLREALDGIVFCMLCEEALAIQSLDMFSDIRDQMTQSENWDGFVLVSTPTRSDLIEDEAICRGFEYVALEETGINEYKEKLGSDRVVEVFQTHEWGNTSTPSSDDNQSGYIERKLGKLDSMSQSLLGPDIEDEDKVENDVDFTNILAKLQLAKENLKDLSPEERDKRAREIVDSMIDYI